ncbi:MAG: 30S ribosomal protein S12 methylthiotransferase RimO [Candidatus Edwardsbacteria bacterium]|nr:30S ribosomal protein S12 methylthiotransferase RimO [Candidatus Edwardsbacteria bacterium]
MNKDKVHFISLGCPKNRVDSEAMIGQLLRNGYELCDDARQADVMIINTCGFLKESVNEALSEIASVALLKEQREFKLVVTGCLVQRMGKQLQREIPEIDALIGVHSYDRLIEIIRKPKHSIKRDPTSYGAEFYSQRQLTTGPGWAYLRIADGCDNRCGYCLIPSIRGKYRSRPVSEIVKEARALAARGVREVNLIAQDTTNYGIDLGGKRKLPELLRRLDAVDGLKWIRLLYTHPAHFDDRIINAIADNAKAVKYLDVPLQHVSDRILKAMNRKIDGKGTRELIAKLRERIPGLVLRTTFIAGLPGETEQEFDELLDFVRTTRFERMGAFAYSAEPGTRAAALSKQIPEDEKQRRLGKLMALQRRISAANNRSSMQRTCEVLVEGEVRDNPDIPKRPGYQCYGRSCAEAPEVDGKVFVRTARKLKPGHYQKVRIKQTWDHDLGGIAN